MSVVDDYLKQAEECTERAGHAPTDKTRAEWLDLAAKWRSMAEVAAARVEIPLRLYRRSANS